MREKAYPALDGLKAFAALGIMMMHIRANGMYNINGAIYNIGIMSLTDFVFLFMMISAFGLCCGYFEKVVRQEISVSDFYGRRFQKIFPFFALMVLVDVVISPSWSAIKEAFADMTLMFGFLPDPGAISVIGVGWFIGLVFVFYLCFPFFCYLLSSKRRAWMAFTLSILWNLLGKNYFLLSRSNILYSGCFFMAGGLLYLYREKVEKVPETIWLVVAIAAAVLYYTTQRNSIAALLLAAALTAIGMTDRSILLENRFTAFLSSISLEIYICHMAVFRVMEKLHFTKLLGDGWLSYGVTVILVLTGAVIVALAAKELIRLTQKFLTRKHSEKRS